MPDDDYDGEALIRISKERVQRDVDRMHDHVDGCLCDCNHSQHEATPDHELPAAKGGVQGDKKPRRPKTDRTSVEEGL